MLFRCFSTFRSSLSNLYLILKWCFCLAELSDLTVFHSVQRTVGWYSLNVKYKCLSCYIFAWSNMVHLTFLWILVYSARGLFLIKEIFLESIYIIFADFLYSIPCYLSLLFWDVLCDFPNVPLFNDVSFKCLGLGWESVWMWS